MTLEQAMSERTRKARVPHWKRRKVIAPQAEFTFAAESFRLVGEIMPAPEPERVAPERAPELFDAIRQAIQLGTPHAI